MIKEKELEEMILQAKNMIKEKELEEMILQAKKCWEIIKDFQSGKSVEEKNLREAVVELRDLLIRLLMQIAFYLSQNPQNPQNPQIISALAYNINKIQNSFNLYLFVHEMTKDISLRRALLTYSINDIPPIEAIIAFYEYILKSTRGSI
jgi:hypothetical protein